MTSRRRKNAGAIAVAVVITLVLGACAGDDAGAGQGATELGNPALTPAETGGADTGPAETGPAETGVENPESPPLAEPVRIGTVTRSDAGCTLELDAEPIPAGAGRLRLVNEMKRWVSFELLRFDPEVLTFAQLEAMVATGKYRSGTFTGAPAGVFELDRGEVGPPGASGVITDNFTTGGSFAVVCLDRLHFDPGFAETKGHPENFVLVGPIVVP
ncbi:MAG: hypothetical protein L0206_09325 [Actinobacteria bacterium]|nr:hypothetical protein [Actinomycetota bacterium]